MHFLDSANVQFVSIIEQKIGLNELHITSKLFS